MADQIGAAVIDSTAFQIRLGALWTASENAKIGLIDPRDDDPVARRHRQWSRAEPRFGCVHAQSPTPLIGLLHDPGLLFCLDCGGEALDQAARSRPDTCDSCGASSRIMHKAMTSATPPITIIGFICESCYSTNRRHP
jgi:hypothetical protein